MTRRLPFLPTLLVLAAVATMVSLGLWQLRRAEWKNGLLARYEGARSLPPIALPAAYDPAFAFRRVTASCLRPSQGPAIAGRNARGESGWSHPVTCRGDGGGTFVVDIGWSRRFVPELGWPGGEVSGVLVPASGGGRKIVSAAPAPGLEPSQPPGPETVPNNHRLYAAQWFFFALAALTIYALALRNRWNAKPA